ncbi:MAG: sugar phosphate nucleotidyltransferase [Patescibacteria group bacterium]|nr:sugar phosphate nucleotidyltransferase [Patescibacteria group bacterium]
MKIVIRAGGSGTRLWPVSRQKKPKHFLPLLGQRSLLEEKVEELKPLLRHWSDLYISVSQPFVSLVRRMVPRLPAKNIIAEPCGRNTGPAIALETVIIEAASQGKDDPVIASLTVDDVFKEAGGFRKALRESEHFLKHHPLWIVAIASSVAQPDPGLSYIEIGRQITRYGSQAFNRSLRWIEKPSGGALTRLHKNPRVFAHT